MLSRVASFASIFVQGFGLMVPAFFQDSNMSTNSSQGTINTTFCLGQTFTSQKNAVLAFYWSGRKYFRNVRWIEGTFNRHIWTYINPCSWDSSGVVWGHSGWKKRQFGSQPLWRNSIACVSQQGQKHGGDTLSEDRPVGGCGRAISQEEQKEYSQRPTK